MIETAIELMRAYGLSGTGINDIVRESGAPKGSVYHFFPEGKVQIACESLAVYAERVEAFVDAALRRRKAGPDKVRALFEAFAQRVEEGSFLRSCAVGAASLDLDADMEPIRVVAAAALSRWIDTIAVHFDLGSRADTRSFAGLLMTAIEGAYVRCRAERSGAPFREAGRWLAPLAALPG
jgi:TetR/AcrR family transcriptional repressor of lmrAB and yxaGH operons